MKSGTLFGVELVDSVTRLCMMNLLLHGIGHENEEAASPAAMLRPGRHVPRVLGTRAGRGHLGDRARGGVLVRMDGDDLKAHDQHTLEELGRRPGMLGITGRLRRI